MRCSSTVNGKDDISSGLINPKIEKQWIGEEIEFLMQEENGMLAAKNKKHGEKLNQLSKKW